MSAPTVLLNNGYKLPIFGLGTYLSQAGEVRKAVKDAIDAGYRHIDCAYFYENEKEVGDAINEKIKDGTVTREDLFVTSKLWNNSHEFKDVVPVCKESLTNLGLDYLDLYLIHWPVAYKSGSILIPTLPNGDPETSDTDYMETWRGMEECQKLGLTRSIGLSNFNSEQIDRVIKEGAIKPVVNQVECNPNINQRKLIEFCKQRDIIVTAFCPLGRPNNLKPGGPQPAQNDPRVAEIAKKYGKSPAQIVLRYLVELGTTPIPKSVTKERIIQNIDIFDFKLTPQEISLLDGFNTNLRVSPFDSCRNHKYFPFAIEF